MSAYNIIKYLLAVILTVNLGWIYALGPEHIGCYVDEFGPSGLKFQVSPGGYDPSAVSPSACAASCQVEKYKYAGLQEGKFCFCSNNLPAVTGTVCNVSCSQNGTDSSTCGGLDLNMDIYMAIAAVPLKGLTLGAPPDSVNTGQSVAFNVSLQSGSDVLMWMDYGDGSPSTSGNATGYNNHFYYLPGNYLVTVSAHDNFQPTKVINGHTEILVKQEVADLFLDCPDAVEPNEVFVCNIQLVKGTSVNMNIDMADGSGMTIFKIPAPKFGMFGHPVPQVPTNDMQTGSVGSLALLGNTMGKSEGFVTAFEAYAVSAGTVKFQVVQVVCSSGAFCYGSKSCESSCPSNPNEISCPAPSVLGTSAGECSDKCSAILPEMNFVEVSSYDANLMVGFNHIELNREQYMKILPGYMMVFDTSSGIIAYRNVTDVEESKGLMDQTASSPSGPWTNLTYTHLASAIISYAATVQIERVYNSIGNFTVAVECSNDVPSSAQNSTVIAVQLPVAGLDLNLTPLISSTNVPFTIIATLQNGSDVSFSWVYGDTLNETTFQSIITPGAAITQNHTFTSEGTYEITVRAMNLLGNDTKSVTIAIESPITTDWTVSSNSPVLEPPGTVTLDVSWIGSGVTPSNPKYKVTWGDGKESQVDFPNTTTTTEISHNYTAGGIFNCSIFVYNSISNHTLATILEVYEEIQGLSAQMYYKNEDTDFNLQKGKGASGEEIPENSDVSIVISKLKGTVVTYIVEDSMGTMIMNTTEKEIPYHVDEPGTYNLSVCGWNPIQGKSSPLLISLIAVDDAVIDVTIDDFFVSTDAMMEKTFEIHLGSIGSESCALIDFGDQLQLDYVIPVAYGVENICFENLTYDDIDYKGPLTHPMNVTHVYERRGTYTVSVLLFNSDVRSEVSLDFSVTNYPCPSPRIAIKSATVRSNPKLHLKSQTFRVDTDAEMSCGNTTLNTTKMWIVMKLDKFGQHLQTMDISSLSSWNKSALFVPAVFLDYGIYKFQYILSISAEGTDYRYPFVHSVITFIEIMQTMQLTGKMSNEVSTRVVRGLKQELILSPGNCSIDPDFPNDKDFNVTWFCRRLAPVEEILPKNGSTYEVTTIIDIPSSKPSSDGGGCFGNGPGAIGVSGGNWNMDTSLFYDKNMVFEILAVVSKSGRQAEAKLEVETVAGSPPCISIRCHSEGLCFPSPRGTVINPTTRLALVAQCDNYCDEPLTYDWKIFDPVTEMEIPESSLYMIGHDTYNVAIKKDLFGNHTGITEAVVQVMATSEGGVTGTARMLVILNAPPKDGQCSLVPNSGTALLDTFELSCIGWIDPEDGPIYQYRFSALGTNGSEHILSFDSESTKKVILPFGTLDILVHVSDSFGAVTELIIEKSIEIDLPNKEEYDQFLNSTELSNIVNGGDQQKICQILSSIASIQNSGSFTPTVTGDNTTDAAASYDYQSALGERVTYLIESLKGITAESLQSMEMVAGVLSLIVANGDGVDLQGKKLAVEQLQNLMVTLNENMSFSSPVSAKQFAQSAISVMGGIATAVSNTLINGAVMPSDLNHVNDIFYDAYAGDDSDFEALTSVDEMHIAAVQASTAYNAIHEITTVVKMVNTLSEKILTTYVAGEDPMTLETQSGTVLTIGKFHGSNISGSSFQLKDASFELPDICVLLGLAEKCIGNETVGVVGVSWPVVLQSFAQHTDVLAPNTRTLQIDIYSDENKLLEIKNTSSPIHMIIPRNLNDTATPMEPTEVLPLLMWNEVMMYHQFNVSKPDAAVNIEITPLIASMRALVFLRYAKKPTLALYDSVMRLVDIKNHNGTYDWFLSNEMLKNKTGLFYLGIAEVKPDSEYSANGNYSMDLVTRNFSCSYTLRIYTSGCYYYDVIRKQWRGQGCYVDFANYSMTSCMSTHLTSFGGGFLVMPNTVDFTYVFAHPSFNDNLTIYVTLIITFLIYLLLLIWARWKDRKDVEKLGASPLPDNNAADKYIYEILAFTGDKAEAATDSTVHFVISGENDETEIRMFGDEKRKIFRKGAMDAFIMTVPRPLGSLHFMRIWHDNTGKGKYASWYMNFIIIRDIQTGEEFNFIGNQWWAVEEGDGQVDRLLPVAGKEQMQAFSHVFSASSQTNLADGHLWFSIFMRPPRSRFTRVQRVSCCIAFLYLTMLVNAMWYGTSVDSPNTSAFRLGPFSLTTEQIAVGFISNVIVFLPNFIIVFLFRKSRPMKLRQSRIDNALEKKKSKADLDEKGKKCAGDSLSDTSSISSHTELIKDNKPSKSKSARKVVPVPSKKCTLPWFFIIIAWLLVFVTIAASVFFLWAYGIQFGNEKTKKWITSLVISFFASVFITQPIKVFLIALLFSAIFKKVDDDADDADEDEVDPSLYPDEEWLHGRQTGKKRTIGIRPLDADYLKKAREERLKEIKMWAVLKEVFAYVLFLWVLIVISYGNRDPNAYFLKQTLENAFVRDGQINGFNNINETKSFWIWTREVLMPNLRAQNLYNDIPPFGLRGFLKDQVNRLMGYTVLRQIRFKPGSCNPPKEMRHRTSCTGLFTKILHEDHKNYAVGWSDFKENEYNDVVDTEFQYQSAAALDGFPTVGALDIYTGGGYVARLQGHMQDILERLEFLEKQHWVDRHTRAVYVEFSVYNAQVNLFGVASMWVEFFAGGGATPHYRFDGIKLLYYYRNFGLFMLICEVIFVMFILYFTYHELRELCRNRREYFKSYWNFAEMAIILISCAAIGVYIYRKVVTTNLLKKFNETKGNGYIKLQFVYSLDEIYGYMLAFVVFASTLKFNKLLRFNKRMGMLSSTLSHACGDLAWFAVSFAIIFLAFVQLFYLLLTTHMVDFSDFLSAIEYCFSMMLQKFDLSRINSACPVLGTVAFFFFSLITTIILINLFLTIVIKAFGEVAHDLSKQSNEYELMEFIKKRFAAFVGFGSARSQATQQSSLNTNSVGKKEEGDKNVCGLPEKVDQLLTFINDSYFEGKMKLNDQKAMKGMLARPKTTYSDSN